MDFLTLVLCFSDKDRYLADRLRVELEQMGEGRLEILMNAASPGRNFASVLDGVSAWASTAMVLVSQDLLAPASMAMLEQSRLHPDLRRDLRVLAVVVDRSSLPKSIFGDVDVIRSSMSDEEFGQLPLKIYRSLFGKSRLRLGAEWFTLDGSSLREPKGEGAQEDSSFAAMPAPRDLKVLLIHERSRRTKELCQVFADYSGIVMEVVDSVEDVLSMAQMSEIGAIGTDIYAPFSRDGFALIDLASKLKGLYPNRDIFFLTHAKRTYRINNMLPVELRSSKWFLTSPYFDIHRLRDHILTCLKRYKKWLDTFAAQVEIDRLDLELYRAIEKHPELLKTLDWRKFEELLADLLNRMKYEVELMQGTKDHGIDIIAFQRTSVFGPQKYLIQAKRWKGKVGIEPVQRLLFQRSHHGATKVCLATTSTFTSGAWRLGGEYQWQLEMRDYNGIREWVRRVLDDPKD